MAHPIVYGPAGSTYVWSARLALAEKGVTHELVDVPFGTHREGPHLTRQPFAKNPRFRACGGLLIGMAMIGHSQKSAGMSKSGLFTRS